MDTPPTASGPEMGNKIEVNVSAPIITHVNDQSIT